MQEAKRDGDMKQVPFWKEHNSEYHTMHQKIDILAAQLGFPFHLVDRRALEFAWPRVRDNRGGLAKDGGPVSFPNMVGSQQAMAACTTGSQQVVAAFSLAIVPRWGPSPPSRV